MHHTPVCHTDFNEHTCVDPDVVLVVGGAGKSPTTSLLITDVRPLSSVCADVYFPYVGGGKGSLTSLKGALKGALTLNTHCMNRYIYFFDISFIAV